MGVSVPSLYRESTDSVITRIALGDLVYCISSAHPAHTEICYYMPSPASICMSDPYPLCCSYIMPRLIKKVDSACKGKEYNLFYVSNVAKKGYSLHLKGSCWMEQTDKWTHKLTTADSCIHVHQHIRTYYVPIFSGIRHSGNTIKDRYFFT